MPKQTGSAPSPPTLAESDLTHPAHPSPSPDSSPLNFQVCVPPGVQWGPGWALDRLDQQTPHGDNRYVYTATGSGSIVYITDTGIRSSHNDLAGRVRWLEGTPTTLQQDCHGHGTHLAGLVAGHHFGVAKNAEVVASRVTDCEGNSGAETLVAALEQIGQVAPKGTTVILISLDYGLRGDDQNRALEKAILRRIAAGQVIVAAAGEGLRDACKRVPAGTPGVITVGATDQQDKQLALSNHGACIDLFAPGADVPSAGHTSDGARRTMSGSSQAAALVAGVAAALLERSPDLRPDQVRQRLVRSSLRDAVRKAPANPTKGRLAGLLHLQP